MCAVFRFFTWIDITIGIESTKILGNNNWFGHDISIIKLECRNLVLWKLKSYCHRLLNFTRKLSIEYDLSYSFGLSLRNQSALWSPFSTFTSWNSYSILFATAVTSTVREKGDVMWPYNFIFLSVINIDSVYSKRIGYAQKFQSILNFWMVLFEELPNTWMERNQINLAFLP